MYLPLPINISYSAYHLRANFIDEFGGEKSKDGTGFFVNDHLEALLVSNRHLFEPGFNDRKYRNWKLNSIDVSGFSRPDYNLICFRIKKFDGPYLSRNESEDVAFLCDFVELEGAERVKVNSIQKSRLADDQYFEKLRAGDFIAVPGYPGFNHSPGSRPLLRMGTVASDPRFDYFHSSMKSHGRCLAYEGFSTSGLSGSPVFALACGQIIVGDGTVVPVRDWRLIGVNAGHLDVFAGASQNHSGISYFFKSSIILEDLA